MSHETYSNPQPIVEVRPLQPSGSGLEARLNQLAEIGVLQRSSLGPAEPPTVVVREGALERFLQERDET